jgi:hypothetical protein
MHKLTSKEADRVIAVLEGSLSKLNALSFVPSIPEPSLLDRLGVDEVKLSLQKQWRLEAAGGASIGEKAHESTRALCRILQKQSKSSREDLEALYSLSFSRNPFLTSFNATLSGLTDVYFRKLRTTVEEDQSFSVRLQDMKERERRAGEERDTLQQALDVNRGEHEREGSALEAAVAKLRNELQSVTDSNAALVAAARKNAEEMASSAGRENVQMKESLQARFEALKVQYTESVEQNRSAEAAARKKRTRLECELGSLITRYDTDMTGMAKALAVLQHQFDCERELLAQLTVHFDSIDANAGRRDDEEAILLRLREQVGRAEGTFHAAAAKIQALFRGRRGRAEVLAKRKKLKKGGKKGKK